MAPGKNYKSGKASRERFLEAAGELLQERGYYGTGLNEILARSGAPRGSLYHHFPGGKDELVIEALRVSGASLGAQLREILAMATDARSGLRAIFETFRTILHDSDFRKGCPVAAVAQETAGDHDEIRTACAAIYAAWEVELAGALQIPVTPDARLLLSILEGALLLAKTRRDVTYLDLAETQLLSRLAD